MSKMWMVLILSVVALLMMGGGFGLYAIAGSMTLLSAALIWLGIMLSLFLLYTRFEEFKKLLATKSTKYGANMLVMVGAFFVISIVAGMLAQSHHKRIDLTRTGRFTLSEQTKKILANLNVKVKALAFYRSESGTMHAKQKQNAKDLLEGYADLSPNFTYTFIDPDKKPGLANKYGVSEYRIILLTSGDKQVKVGNELENKFTNGLIKLLQEKAKVVYFVKGHGEKNLSSTSKHGYRAARDAMMNQRLDVRELMLERAPAIPKDASVVVMASPERDLTPEEYAKLDAYYKSGGAMLVEIDPGHPPTLTTWLETHGFKLMDDVIIDQQSKVYGSNFLTPVVYSYHKKHPLTVNFKLMSYFPIANSVYIDEDPKRGRYELAFTGPNSWTEVDRNQLESGKAEYNEEREKRGPVPVMAVTTSPAVKVVDKDGGTREKYGKLILIGDSDFANNTNFNLAGNGDLFMNTISWLAEEADLVAVRAKKRQLSPVILTVTQGRAIFWIPVVMIPCTVLLAGIGVFSWRKWFR